MASVQRAPPRRGPPNTGPLRDQQLREASPSPTFRERPRALKTQSMPLVPPYQQVVVQPQGSPNLNGRRSPQLGPGQMARLLPTPPHPYHFGEIDENQWQMTPELMADIERADLAQYHSQNGAVRDESPSPPRARGPADRGSPSGQQRRLVRESPKVRERQAPGVAAAMTPERRASPAQHSPLVIPSEPHPSSYLAQYNARTEAMRSEPRDVRDSSPPVRRPANTNLPSTQSLPARNPDRSLPFQEEAEEEIAAAKNNVTRWKNNDGTPSPPLSSDLQPDQPRYGPPEVRNQDVQPQTQYIQGESAEEDNGYTPRSPTVPLPDETPPYHTPPPPAPTHTISPHHRASVAAQAPASASARPRLGTTEQGMRSLDSTLFEKPAPPPAQPLPPAPPPPPQQPPQQSPQQQQQPVPQQTSQQPPAPQQQPQQPPPLSQQSPVDRVVPKYSEPQRRPVPSYDPHPLSYPPSQAYLSHQYQYQYEEPIPRYVSPQVYPDDFQNFSEDTSAIFQSYITSPRPDAPVPPTPQNGTAAPSPAPPLPNQANGESNGSGSVYQPPSRAVIAGSPYPAPFNHVRRMRPAPSYDPNSPAMIAEQMARQWQIFAQNNQGDMTDSTLSPTTNLHRPRGRDNDMYTHWAYLHTNKMLGRSNMAPSPGPSLHSSPSHQPVPLPMPQHFAAGASRRRGKAGSKRVPQSHPYSHHHPTQYSSFSARKPPPRVQSTQPRETSPELSSSGEETAGEDKTHVPPLGSGSGPGDTTDGSPPPATPSVLDSKGLAGDRDQPISIPIINDTHGDGDQDDEHDANEDDWVDEDEEDDYEDLIDLEYHPAYVKNVAKRRRKWEVGWENLIQAFQALDRQTDATMILLASPSHSTKLHQLRSRSIRRSTTFGLGGGISPMGNTDTSVELKTIKNNFGRIAAQRRESRAVSHKASVVERFMMSQHHFSSSQSGLSSAGGGGDGSDGTGSSVSLGSGVVEDNLRRALDAALGSLGQLGTIYEEREARVLEELQRSREDKDKVELLLRQVLGEGPYPTLGGVGGSMGLGGPPSARSVS